MPRSAPAARYKGTQRTVSRGPGAAMNEFGLAPSDAERLLAPSDALALGGELRAG